MFGVIFISFLTVFAIIITVIFKPEIIIRKKSFESFWIVAFIGVILLISFNYISIQEIIFKLTESSLINPFKILIIFISMTIISIVLDELGFFKRLAIMALKKAKGSQLHIFLYMYITISILTIFTSNDIIILTFTPFICYFTKNAKINPIPYLISEFVAANTWSMLLVIGNPTNIYLASSYQISFGAYFQMMFFPTVISALFALCLLLLIFKKELSKKIEIVDDYLFVIENKKMIFITLSHLIICIILLAISSYLKLEMWYICLTFSISVLIILILNDFINHTHPSCLLKTLKRTPWSLIPFVLSMFVFVLVLNKYHITSSISLFLNQFNPVFIYGFSSFFTANIINNIPMTILYSDILKSISQPSLIPALYASVIGSNIGAYFTPIGALAGIMWLRIIKKANINLTFNSFLGYGFKIAIPTIIVALVVMLIIIY